MLCSPATEQTKTWWNSTKTHELLKPLQHFDVEPWLSACFDMCVCGQYCEVWAVCVRVWDGLEWCFVKSETAEDKKKHTRHVLWIIFRSCCINDFDVKGSHLFIFVLLHDKTAALTQFYNSSWIPWRILLVMKSNIVYVTIRMTGNG